MTAPLQHPPVSIALVGCGNFARRQHLPNLARLPGAQLAAVCDADPATAAAAAKTFGARSAFTALHQVLEEPGIQAVVLTVRDDLQAELGCQVLRAGKSLYVEKPAAESEADFQRLIDAQQQSGGIVAVGFQKRFAPAYRAVREVLLADGGPRNVFCRMADDAWRWAHGYPPGALLHHDACHLFDLLRYFTGAEVKTVVCAASRPDDDALLLVFDHGVTATLLHSGHASLDFPKERFEAVTQRGGVIMDDFVETRAFGMPGLAARQTFPLRAAETGAPPEFCGGIGDFLVIRRRIWEEMTQTGGPPRIIPNFLRDQGWEESMRAFLQAVHEGSPGPHATLEDARAAARIADAACRSRETGLPVSFGDSVHA